MSLWGKSESQLAGSGTVAINLGTGVVTGTNSTFSAAMVGSVITVGTAGTCGEAVITGIAYTVTQKPISTLGDVGYGSSEIYGVDTTEQTVANAASGEARKYAPPHAGWVGIQTYNDMHGNFRVKSETLVASSSITGDAADDAKFPDS